MAAAHGSESPHKDRTGLRHIWNATRYSMDGLHAAFRHEHAFRLEVMLAVVLIPSALLLPAPGYGKALMVASVLLVLVVELLNTGIEAAIDRIGLERHPLSKRAKDMGSAAVFLSLVIAGGIWAAALWRLFFA